MKRYIWLTMIGAIALAWPAVAGTYYEASTMSQGDQGKTATRIQGWVDGDSAKILVVEGKDTFLKKGSYLLTTDGGRTVFLVDPKEKTYMEWDLEVFLGGIGSAMQSVGPMVKMNFSNHESKEITEEAGPELYGLSTTHYVTTSSYDMEIKVMGMGQGSHVEMEQELWTTTELEDSGFGVWLRREPPKTGIEGLDELIASHVAQVPGLPLKSVTTTVSTDNKRGRKSTSTTRTEVTLLEEQEMSNDLFELEEGYRRTEAPTLEGLFGSR